MSKILPFKGYLPPPHLAKAVSSPPYDTLTSDEARTLFNKNPSSFLRIIKPEINFTKGRRPSNIELHQEAFSILQRYISVGKLVQDKNDSFYLYQISQDEHTQTGVIAAVSVQEYNNSLIRKHEYTRPDKENDRTMHIDITGANTGPVFLTFKDSGDFKSQIFDIIDSTVDISFQAEDGSTHKIWKVNNVKLIIRIKSYFENVTCLYIADGHHRAASASRVQKIWSNQKKSHNIDEPYNYFLATIFPHYDVQILSYNRVVKDLNGLDYREFLSMIENNFTVNELTEPKKPEKKYSFSMFMDNVWYDLKAKSQIFKGDKNIYLDAQILQDYILNPILNIYDPRISERIDFVGGVKGLEELERRCNYDAKVAFALHPVSIEDLMSISDEGKVMPPKSTWFEPKLRSGLLVRLLK